MKRFLILASLLLGWPAYAQQAAPSDPVATQMGTLVIEVLRLQQTVQTLQGQLTQASAQAKALKDKYEPEPKKE